ncbi:MAG: LysR family transcriptional regulator [Myxococcota bacterium]|nr:LysR family transcriptional regulator [Myxococcota bacterium]
MTYIHEVNLSAIDMNLLVILDALLSEKSVTRAARRVGLSQPAMSNALSRLRAMLGDPVLVRSSKGMVPTPFATELAAPLRDALATVDRVLAPRKFDPLVARREFTISTTDSVEMRLMPKLMARLASDAPGVHVRVIPPSRGADPTELLESGGADIAIMNTTPVRPPLEVRDWFREQFVCIARKEHPHLRGRLTLAKFTALRHVLVAPYGSGGSVVDDALAARSLRRTVAVRVSSFLSAPVIVAESECIATVSARLAHRCAEWLPLQIHAPPLPLPDMPIGAVWHPRVEDDDAHRWFRDLLESIEQSSPSPRSTTPRSSRSGRYRRRAHRRAGP